MIDELPPMQHVYEILAKRLNEWLVLGWEEVIIGLKYGMVCMVDTHTSMVWLEVIIGLNTSFDHSPRL